MYMYLKHYQSLYITYLDKLQKIYKNCRSAPTLFKRQAERLKASKHSLKVKTVQSSAKFDCSIKIWDNHFHIQLIIQLYVSIYTSIKKMLNRLITLLLQIGNYHRYWLGGKIKKHHFFMFELIFMAFPI